MIRIEQVPFRAAPKAVEWLTVGTWDVYNGDSLALTVGVMRDTMLGLPRLWLVLAEPPKLSTLRAVPALLRLAKRRFPGLEAFATTERDWRFAALCGFKLVSHIDGWWRGKV